MLPPMIRIAAVIAFGRKSMRSVGSWSRSSGLTKPSATSRPAMTKPEKTRPRDRRRRLAKRVDLRLRQLTSDDSRRDRPQDEACADSDRCSDPFVHVCFSLGLAARCRSSFGSISVAASVAIPSSPNITFRSARCADVRRCPDHPLGQIGRRFPLDLIVCASIALSVAASAPSLSLTARSSRRVAHRSQVST